MQIVGPDTLVSRLRACADAYPDQTAYRYLPDGTEGETLSFGALDRDARAIAAGLQARFQPGDRALLVISDGLHFVRAFFGCLYAGLIAVPSYPPDPRRRNRTEARLQSIAKDAGICAVLTGDLTDLSIELVHALGAPPVIDVSALQQEGHPAFNPVLVVPDTVAFLQYTSGSTGNPKGVIVTHGNVRHNQQSMKLATGLDEPLRVASWLPLFHDMGLIGAALFPVSDGGEATLMPPTAFMRQPARWLQAIDRYKANMAGGPNFGYMLCIQRISEKIRETLDLSSWRVAFSGAEPIRAETLEGLLSTFAPCGMRAEAIRPSYGLAEGTLMASVTPPRETLRINSFENDSLITGEARLARDQSQSTRRVPSCGTGWNGSLIAVVDPDTGNRCADGTVGEIWSGGASVAQGYWQRPEETAATFGHRLADWGDIPTLRTGDLGFMHDGEVHVLGRMKDLIIIRGRNIYPEDVEITMQSVDPRLRTSGGVACGIDIDDEERLVLIQECSRVTADDAPAILESIRQAITTAYDVQPHAIYLVRSGTVPRTSSGKLERRATQRLFQEARLDPLYRWQASDLEKINAQPPPPLLGTHSAHDIETWLREAIAKRTGLTNIDRNAPIAEFGLDSLQATEMIVALEQATGQTIQTTVLFDYPTIAALAGFLTTRPDAHAAPSLQSDPKDDGVAIIGMACRFPGAPDLDAFWELLVNGTDAISDVPRDRWNAQDYFSGTTRSGRSITRWGGFLENVRGFDHRFFGIGQREAIQIDPQQRLLLETTWEAMEDAGIPLERLSGSQSGVYVGISANEYHDAYRPGLKEIEAHTATGAALSIAANRISYALDLQGPSLAVDTACSSSLVAIHLACEAIRNGACETAFAGGANMMFLPQLSVNFSQAGVMADDGRCKFLDAGANGYVRGEGVGMIALKSLAQARQDGDRVYAVVHGSAVMSDGRTNGLMAPSEAAQRRVIRKALDAAGVSGDQIQVVEAHGTGTKLGDQIEMQALGGALQRSAKAGPVRVGSVKTNLGHLEAAAGVAGIIKLALSLHKRTLAPTLHLVTPAPDIDLAGLGIAPLTQTTAWPEPSGSAQRLGGVSAFGFGGTICHAVLGSAEAPARTQAKGSGPYLLTLSARSEDALRAIATKHSERLTTLDDAQTARWTAASREARTALTHRLAVSAPDRAGLLAALTAQLSAPRIGTSSDGSARTAFVFAGQGPEWWPLPADWRSEPAFAETLSEASRHLSDLAGWSLLDLLADSDRAQDLLRPSFAQPALIAVQLATANLLDAWDVTPDVVVGHSVGEVAAAAFAGAFPLREALRIAHLRGLACETASTDGAMAVLGLPSGAAGDLLAKRSDGVTISAVNSAQTTIVSGARDAIGALVEELTADGHFARALDAVTFASHSPAMQAPSETLLQSLGTLAAQPPVAPLFSTVDAQDWTAAPDADYFARNLRQPVLFSPALAELHRRGITTFVEISGHPTLLGSIEQDLGPSGASAVATLVRGECLRAAMLRTVGSVWSAGAEVEWSRLFAPIPGPRPDLPRYPWQREICWPDAKPQLSGTPAAQNAKALDHPFLNRHWSVAGEPDGTTIFSVDFDPDRHAFFSDHRIQGQIVVASPALIETVVGAVRASADADTVELTDVAIHRAILCGARPPEVQLRMDPVGPAAWRVRMFSRSAGTEGNEQAWALNMSAQARVPGDAPDLGTVPDDAHAEAGFLPVEDHFAAVRERGLDYGPGFRGLARINRGSALGTGTLHRTNDLGLVPFAGTAHPAIMDASWQILATAALATGSYDHSRVAFVPVGMDRIVVTGQLNEPRRTLGTLSHTGVDRFSGDVSVADAEGRVFYRVEGLAVRQLELDRAEPGLDSCRFEPVWQTSDEPLPPAGSPAHIVAISDGGEVSRDLVARLPGHLDAGARLEHVEIPEAPAEDIELWATSLAQQLAEGSLEAPARLLIVTSGTAPDSALAAMLDAAERPLWAVLSLAKACHAQSFAHPPKIWIATQGGASPAVGSALPDPAQGAIRGVGLDLALDDLVARLVDLDPAADPDTNAASLAREIDAPSSEGQVCYRDGARLVPRVRAASAPLPEQSFRPQADGTILITGGLGDIGLEIAGWLVSRGATRLVLMGRRAFDLRNPAPEDRPLAHRLKALEAEGATILYVPCDIADEATFATALADIERVLPPVTGVIHAAGIVKPGPLDALSHADAMAVLRPKLAGALVLDRVLDRPLEFFVMLSSVSSVWGTRWVAPYAAANHVLDVLAARRVARGRTATSINFGSWGEVGMVTRSSDGERAAMTAASGLRPMSTALALAGLGDAMTGAPAQRIVAALDLPVLRDLLASRTPFGSILSALELPPAHPASRDHEAADSDFATALRSADPETRQQKILDWLGIELGQLSAASPRDPASATVADYNLDSLMGMQLKMRVSMAMGIDLPIMTLLAEPSLKDLSATLAEAVLQRASGPEAKPKAQPVPVEQPEASGQIHFSAAQARFLHTPPDDLHHWNCAGLPVVHWPGRVDIATLQTAAHGVFAAHSGLRLSLGGTPGNWSQTPRAPEHMVSVDQIEIPDNETASLEAAALDLHANLDPMSGPVMRIGVLQEPGTERSHLIFALHHLVADAYCARMVIEDLITSDMVLRERGAMPDLHATTTFEQATAHAFDHAQSTEMSGEAAFWLAKPWDAVGRLPVERDGGTNVWTASERVHLSLGAPETAKLSALATTRGYAIEEILLAAVGSSLGRWSGAGAVPVELVHHGRQDMFDGINLARTAGWHNSYYPVLMSGAGDAAPAKRLREARRELRSTPNHGAGFCQLAYLRRDALAAQMRALPEPEVSFNYLARLDTGPARAFNLETSVLSDTFTRSRASRRKFALFVSSRVRSKALEITLTYGSDTHRRETIERVGQDMLADLRALAAALEDGDALIPAGDAADGA